MKYALWLEKAKINGEAIVADIYRRTKHQLETKIRRNVSSHNLRRSINDWIKKTPLKLSPEESLYKASRQLMATSLNQK